MIKLETLHHATLDELASTHFIGLNPSDLDVNNEIKLDEKSIIYQLQQAIKDHIGIEKDFFEFLIGKNGETIKKVLIGMPEELEEIIVAFHTKFPILKFKYKNSQDLLVWNDLGKVVTKIFDYTKYRASSLCLDHLKSLGLSMAKPCPYCNLDDIGVVNHAKIEGKQLALLDLDHFFPRSLYPFLGVSLFNLIPTCKNCNEVYKKRKIFTIATHVHPYITDLDDLFVFRFNEAYVYRQPFGHLKFTYSSKSSFPDKSLVDLGIMERYDIYLDKVIAKINRLYKRPIKTLVQVFGSDYDEERRDYLAGMGIPIDKDDIRNHTLGKLYRDLCLASEIYF